MPDKDLETPQTFTLEGREIFAVGVHNGDRYTTEDLDDIADNFNRLSSLIKPPLKLGHNGAQEKETLRDGQPALGWVENVRRMGEKLVADFVQVPAVVYAAISSGRYKRISPEIVFKLKNHDQTYNTVLWAVSLLGADVPAVKNLLDIDKSVGALLSADTKDGLEFASLQVYSLEVKEGVITKTKKEIADMGEIEVAKAEAKKYSEDLIVEKGERTKLEAEVKEYKEKETQRMKDEETAGRVATVADVKKYCEEAVTAGKMLPVTRDSILTAVESGQRSYSHEHKAVFLPFEILKGYVETVEKVFVKEGEKGSGEKQKEYTDVKAEIHDRTLKWSTEHKVEYEDAMTTVLREDDDLRTRYEAEMRGEGK